MASAKQLGPTPPPSGEPDVVQVIQGTARVERLLNSIIFHYCSPRPGARIFVLTVLLDTSVMSLGGKFKAARAIAVDLDVKIDWEPLRKVVELRNAFAHHALDDHAVLVVGREDGEWSSRNELWILRQSGKMEHKERVEALDEFNANLQSALTELRGLLKVVKEHSEIEDKG